MLQVSRARTVPLWMAGVTVELILYRLDASIWVMTLFALLCVVAYWKWSWLTETRTGVSTAVIIGVVFVVVALAVPRYRLLDEQARRTDIVLELLVMSARGRSMISQRESGALSDGEFVATVASHDREARALVHSRLGPHFSDRLTISTRIEGVDQAVDVLRTNLIHLEEFMRELSGESNRVGG